MLEHVAQGPVAEPKPAREPDGDDVEDYVRERCGEIDESIEREQAIRDLIDKSE